MPRTAINGDTRIRNFMFTLNNPEPAEKEFWSRLASGGKLGERIRARYNVGYVVYQEEKGANGTPHLQGYVELTNSGYRIKRIKVLFGTRLHVDKRLGNQGQAIAYVQKEDTRVLNGAAGEGGVCKKLGRDKLSCVAQIIKENKPRGYEIKLLEIDYPATFIKFGSKIRSYAIGLHGRRDARPEIRIYFGKTMTGKSAKAFSGNKDDIYWCPWPMKGGWWWPDYRGENTVVLDEFRHQIKYDTMLNLFDRYPFVLQEKGTNMQMISNKIIITTNVDPYRWYPNLTDETKAPLWRRFADFCTIYDVADDSTWRDFKATIRTEQGPAEKYNFNVNRDNQDDNGGKRSGVESACEAVAFAYRSRQDEQLRQEIANEEREPEVEVEPGMHPGLEIPEIDGYESPTLDDSDSDESALSELEDNTEVEKLRLEIQRINARIYKLL